MDSCKLQAFERNPREENRKFLRFPLSLKAECHYNVREAGQSCRVVDISGQGLGLELEIPVRLFNGQLVLLSIDIGHRRAPVSAIAKLAWVHSHEDGFFMQRAGSSLLFMDPKGKERLLEHAHEGIISVISRGAIGVPG